MPDLRFPWLYPVWKTDYDDLARDLDASRVPCVVSSSTVDQVAVGEVYNRELRSRLAQLGGKEEAVKVNSGSQMDHPVDMFGEKGEFHTLARVWEVERNVALGYGA